jgi:hypothetical protein
MHAAIDADTLLTVWERALELPDSMRADALLQAAFNTEDTGQSLGARNVQLATLHEQLFGRDVDLRSHCADCGTTVEFRVDCQSLAITTGAPAATHLLHADGYVVSFRLPCRVDVTLASQHHALDEDFAASLLRSCVISCVRDGVLILARDISAGILDAVSRQIEVLDPAACISFALDCPQCGLRWNAPLDLDQVVWQKLEIAAQTLLLDVDALARTYGWNERDVIALSPTRRAAYVQMASS